ncbi:MAG: protein kinase [Anaerolineales bacterium]|nr:protein kinase [Anaerolineales bacterium]
MSFTIGENVGPYRVVEPLGQGGMATVFKAYHAGLDRYVAIKVLHPAFKEDANFLARFQREARVVAKLEHPNIVPVYDFAEHNGAPYLVMKFIEGETLKARLQRERLSLRETLGVLEAVGGGLDYAHKQGILHRDIKSSNIMLAAEGGIYLADFGLARIASAGESTLSMDSMVGTPHYMSPEQARGVKDLDAGTDIYSLGVVLYELVVGRLPYSADTPFAIIHDHIFTPLPMPRSVNVNVPEVVERVLLKALAKDRADRFGDVAAMVNAFRGAVSGVDSGVVALPAGLPVSPAAPTAPGAATVAGTAVTPQPEPTLLTPKPKEPTSALVYWLIGAIVVVALGLAVLFAFSYFRRNQAAPPTIVPTLAPLNPTQPPAPTSVPATATPSQLATRPPASPAPQNTPPAGQAPPWKAAVDEAAALFPTAPQDALTKLNAAVQANAADPGVYLAAGDLALANNFPKEAVEQFYLPAFSVMPTDENNPLNRRLRENLGLAYYVLSGDFSAAPYLTEAAQSAGEFSEANLALQRWRILYGDLAVVAKELESMLNKNSEIAALQLVYGDYASRANKPVEAILRYEAASRPRATNPAAPWVIQEALCRLQVLRDRKPELKPTCEPLNKLVQPVGPQP